MLEKRLKEEENFKKVVLEFPYETDTKIILNALNEMKKIDLNEKYKKYLTKNKYRKS